ncbi:MAG: alpha/beta fold hydrolase [Clostridia bacterium]|nr:alpha/beta fold hydrolase [Clostridia bacterium]
MNYNLKEFSFPSSDGKNTLHAEIYEPIEGEIKGVVQLSHGMVDHVGRYGELAEYLTGEGFVFAGNDHLGHGKSVADKADFGFFASKDGYKFVIDDLYAMNAELHKRYEGKPVILMGHSMGSFLARLYAVKYPTSIDGIIIHGTGGKNPALPFGMLVVKLLRLIKGERYRSPLVKKLSFMGYNSRFDKSEGENAWLTRAGELVSDRDGDERTNFIFTLAGYNDLFTMLGECNGSQWYSDYPKTLPTILIAGTDDPVGNFGEGVREVYDGLSKAGVVSLEIDMYEGARHELFNETNRAEVFRNMCDWLESVVG